MKQSFFGLLLVGTLLILSGFTQNSPHAAGATKMTSTPPPVEKIFPDITVHYDKAKKNNRELIRVIICATDAQGNLYTGFGPADAKLFTNIWVPTGLLEHVEIEQMVVQGTNGYYGLWLQPGKTDKWRKGTYVLGYQLKNTTHQCAGMIRIDF